MVCNLSKTELIVFGLENLEVTINNSLIKSSETMKVLGVLLDNKLSWEHHVDKIIKSCRSKLFSLRYLRQHLPVETSFLVFKSHIVSKLVYGSPAWSVNLSYNLMSKLRSVFFRFIRVLLRDFDHKLNRNNLLRQAKIESLDTIFFKRNSVFLFNIIKNISPSRLACELLARSYINERQPNRLTFFDISMSRIGKKSILNQAKFIAEKWQFDWINLSAASFKSTLKECFGWEVTLFNWKLTENF